jgi:hypothetical protein
MKKLSVLWFGFISFVHAIPFEELYGTDAILDNDGAVKAAEKQDEKIHLSFARAKLLHDFLLPKMRFFGNFVPEKGGKKEGVAIHKAFPQEDKEKLDERKMYSYPQDPVSSLMQHLFPSVDGSTLMFNSRNKDPFGILGGGENQKNKSDKAEGRKVIAKIIYLLKKEVKQIKNEDFFKISENFMKDFADQIKSALGNKKLTLAQEKKLKKIQQEINETKDKIIYIQNLDLTEFKKLNDKKDALNKEKIYQILSDGDMEKILNIVNKAIEYADENPKTIYAPNTRQFVVDLLMAYGLCLCESKKDLEDFQEILIKDHETHIPATINVFCRFSSHKARRAE